MRKFCLNVSLLVILFSQLVAQAEVKTSVQAMGLSFISPDFESVDKSNFAFIGASLVSNQKAPEPFMINVSGFYSVGQAALSYHNFKEIYFSVTIDQYSQIHIGRKLKNWSALDSDWNLGFFQPQFRWNPLSPENQGLTGVFWDHDEPTWGISLFASPLFLPDQGPGYEVKNGQFENLNPWFNAPPKNLRFQGQEFPIDYTINTPETSDVVLQSVYATQLRFGEKHGWFANLAAAYKPAHQFALGYGGVLVTSRVKIDVTPKTYQENIYSGDFGIRENWGLAQISFLATKPQQPKFDNVSNTPVFSDSLSWGPRVAYNALPVHLGAALLLTQGGEITEQGPDASTDRQALSQRFLFREAVQIQAKYSEIFMKKYKWDSVVQYTQSTKDEFKQIRLNNKLDVKGPWAFWADILLIDTIDDSMVPLNAYRNLDQLWLGVSYDI